jgi:hypothetical protein
MLITMNTGIDEILPLLHPQNQKPAFSFWDDLQTHIPDAAGSSKSHQAWEGGYKDHIQEVVNIARILYQQLHAERPLQFSLSSAYLVLFLHDCEKPFRRASKEQLVNFPWIEKRPAKSDKLFQKLLVEHYGFVISDDEWNALRYVEGEPETEYIEGERLQGPLAAFCHICDTISARIWHDYPRHSSNPL